MFVLSSRSRGDVLAGVCLLVMCAGPASAGDLEPPAGPVGSTMKALDVVEPRVAVGPDTTPGDAHHMYVIDRSGSYYLTANIAGEPGKTGIKVLAPDVTLDLNGFTIRGTPASDHGIEVDPDAPRFTCRNGIVADWPLIGVMAEEPGDVHIEGVTVASSGSMGMIVYNGIIRDCTVLGTGSDGIYASYRSIIEDCHVRTADGNGIRAGADSIVRGCLTVRNTGSGIVIGGPHATVRDCTTNRNDGAGIHIVGGVGSLVTANTVCDNAVGLMFAAGGNTCRDNHVQDNADNYDFVPGNSIALRLSEIPETIDWPASVTLEGTLTGESGEHGIDIRSGDVTLDLGGHTLVGVEGSLTGIVSTVEGADGIAIRNGMVRDWGEAGIDITGASPGRNSDQHIDAVRALRNGQSGIRTGFHAIVTGCVAVDNNGYGIGVGNTSVVERCTAKGNGDYGISIVERSIARTCVAEDNLTSGFSGYQSSTFIECSAGGNAAHGFRGYRINVLNCLAFANAESGIDMSDDCIAQNNRCIFNANGIRAAGDGNVIEGNLVRGNTMFGITVDGMDNIATCNRSVNDATAFQFLGDTVYGPIVNAAGGGDLSAITGSDHPSANIMK